MGPEPRGINWIGLDVGGANLKIADASGRAASRRFALWKHPERLSEELERLLGDFGGDRAGIALTMTGELCDCFRTKADGVRAIIGATVGAARGPVRVASVSDRWLAPNEAIGAPEQAAASNWRVAARWVAATLTRPAVWIDCGSTTVDVIPVAPERVLARGNSDTERLIAGELVYTGVRRTPVCAVVRSLPYRGAQCPVMAEWFATTADAWLLLGALPEDPGDRDGADGGPLTIEAACDRVARCLGADRSTFTPRDAEAAAGAIADAQVESIVAALRAVAPGAELAIVSGEGEFLARRAVARFDRSLAVESIALRNSAAVSQALPAFAAASLGAKELGTPS